MHQAVLGNLLSLKCLVCKLSYCTWNLYNAMVCVCVAVIESFRLCMRMARLCEPSAIGSRVCEAAVVDGLFSDGFRYIIAITRMRRLGAVCVDVCD
jgi:hypothetical protein